MNIYAHVVQDTQPEAVSHLDRTPTRRSGRE
ncbi:integrase [Streptomyces sp. NPDC096310]